MDKVLRVQAHFIRAGPGFSMVAVLRTALLGVDGANLPSSSAMNVLLFLKPHIRTCTHIHRHTFATVELLSPHEPRKSNFPVIEGRWDDPIGQ